MTYVVTLDSRFVRRTIFALALIGAGVYFYLNPDDLEAVKTQMRAWYLLP